MASLSLNLAHSFRNFSLRATTGSSNGAAFPSSKSGGPVILEIPLDKIRRPLMRTRANDPKKVEELMESIREIGLQEPIDVLEVDGVYYGFSGCHRYEAHQRLGFPTIRCKIRRGTKETLRTNLLSAGQEQRMGSSKQCYHGIQCLCLQSRPTPTERKYLKGSRPSRTAGDGFWKATSIEKEVLGGDQSIIGYKKTLVFYYKEKNKKTNWIMHEYRIDKTDGSIGKQSLKMDGFVICRIYERHTKASKSDTRQMIQSFEYDTRTPISSLQSAEGDANELMQLCQGESNCFTEEMTRASKSDTRMDDHLIQSFEYDTCTPISSLQIVHMLI
ncbi:sulfiredoxin, chloroplastic/mitochondrial [Cinnamomum micranthum f. kanehirae]|uniref:sulfiredoxin n=1 Tax=Cinnamomum micranthum f. kanehirae TaxID=337451 RepID=A0A443PCQ3_9MAGN|nr:sulfiredoxin, chloroplastic/mitochondrial [Cinnamomum micranthum f. kanehirae]